MAHQRSVRVLAPLLQELVVQRVVDALLLVARVPRQQVDDARRPRILGREVQRHASLEESAQGLVDRGRLDHGVDRVSVPVGGRQGLDGENERSFGAHVAVGFSIEGMARAFRADDAHEVEAAAHPAAARIGDGAGERLFAIAARERIHRRVQGTQAGGAGRAVGRGRSHEVEVVRDPIGQHGKADAGYRILRDTMLRPPVGYGGNLRAYKDAGGAVAQ